MIRPAALAAALLIAGCSGPANPPGGGGGNRSTERASVGKSAARQDAAEPAAQPAAPGTAGGRPEDRTPVAEAPVADTSAQGAADVVRHYYALIAAGRFADAWRLWSDGGKASGKTEADFAAGFAAYRDDHAQVDAPGAIEGAAGSLYVDVPVQLHGHLRDGSPFARRATVTLRRVNDVPGSTAEQRRWHISSVTAAGSGGPS